MVYPECTMIIVLKRTKGVASKGVGRITCIDDYIIDTKIMLAPSSHGATHLNIQTGQNVHADRIVLSNALLTCYGLLVFLQSFISAFHVKTRWWSAELPLGTSARGPTQPKKIFGISAGQRSRRKKWVLSFFRMKNWVLIFFRNEKTEHSVFSKNTKI